MRLARTLALALALVASPLVGLSVAHAVDVRVGQSPTCDTGSIQAALTIAAASGAGPHVIHLSNEIAYDAQRLFIGGIDVTLVGEHGCDDETPQTAALNGDGQNSVITVTGTNNATITLRNLLVRGGGDDGSGGGLDIRGAVNVVLDGSVVRENASGDGGGVYIQNAVGASSGTLLLLPGSSIEHNTATGVGGGVYAEGGRVRMHARDTAIRDNTAAGGGGGLALFGGELASGKYLDDAADGSANGARVSGNHAGTVGGGIYLYGNVASVFGYELIVEQNAADFAGGGIAASNGAQVVMQRDYPNVPSQFNCPPTMACSRLSENRVANGEPDTRGGGIALYANARAYLMQTLVTDNIAGDGSGAWIDGSRLDTEAVLFSRNHNHDSAAFGSAVIHARYELPSAPPQLNLAYTTFGGNLGTRANGDIWPAADVIAQQDTQSALHSVAFFDAAYTPLYYSAFTSDCVVHRGGGGWPEPHGANTRYAVTDLPGFVDAANGDFHLRADSILVDYCDTTAYVPQVRDPELNARCVDAPDRPDGYGPCDVGAYALGAPGVSDRIFADGFDA